ncbi:hypothetical protein QFC21_002132 [Naganishia friedmannii]|uniref:Uncharacterized protein n=1 Tax=Naganishia friedmannii TaxID=89922 RepID=A0ACC2VYT4_9TREE|nr:hypothetical protein QFC21_002132 [Naganishia friedmannii]
MPILQFTPLSSFPSPSFWQQLTTIKLDTLKLDDSARDIRGWLEEGRSVLDRESGEEVWMSGHLMVDGTKRGKYAGCLIKVLISSVQPNIIPLHGKFRNFNTIEEFRSPDLKKQLFSETVQDLIHTFSANNPSRITTFNPFLLVSFADLKKYVYHYWFAFPALVQKPAWEIVVPDQGGESGSAESGMRDWKGDADHLRQLKLQSQITAEAFLYRPASFGQPADAGSVAPVAEWWSFFEGVPENERTLVFHDPTSSATLPGWTLRNVLYYLAHHLPAPTTASELAPPSTPKVTLLKVIALRSGTGNSKVFNVRLPSSGDESRQAPLSVVEGKEGVLPAAVGWERNSQGKLASRVADLGSTMDPKQLADQAVDLNLKLMRWRIMPSLDLEKIAGTRCLLLGAGTLGCYVARGLLGWGIRNITFVDSAKVSFSNPARQPLFEFEDSLAGGKPKAAAAAASLKRIFPNVNANGIAMSIPMPGHPVSSTTEASTRETVAQLESLIKAHDVVFLLMDSRESRWLPTLLATMENKIVINAALGFDSWLVMRHGAASAGVNGDADGTGEGQKKRLGCYFCNDIVAPTDSLTDRTLDQMCTVTRPGIAPIAAASAVELMVSLIQHPEGIYAPAEGASTAKDAPELERRSPLGLVPHQLRGFLGQWKTMLIEGAAYDRCTGCSVKIVEAYRERGFDMLLRAFNESDYLQSITGLDELYEEGEAALEAIDWDEGSDGGSL